MAWMNKSNSEVSLIRLADISQIMFSILSTSEQHKFHTLYPHKNSIRWAN